MVGNQVSWSWKSSLKKHHLRANMRVPHRSELGQYLQACFVVKDSWDCKQSQDWNTWDMVEGQQPGQGDQSRLDEVERGWEWNGEATSGRFRTIQVTWTGVTWLIEVLKLSVYLGLTIGSNGGKQEKMNTFAGRHDSGWSHGGKWRSLGCSLKVEMKAPAVGMNAGAVHRQKGGWRLRYWRERIKSSFS